MSEPLVLRRDADGLATLLLNRPAKLNALDYAVFVELAAHLDAIAGAPGEIGCVVLRGVGRCFSAGHDLHAIATGEDDAQRRFQGQTVERLAELPQPVIVAVHGHCYTGALELALAGDIILAAESARFADTHARWGLVPVWGGSQRLPRRIGLSRARDMMLTAETLTGADAAANGLANRCWPDARFDEEVERYARMVLANSWHSHRANKRLLAETDGLPLSAGLSHEVYRSAGRAADMAARIDAFARRPRG